MPETPEKAPAATASPKSSPSKKEIDAATEALNHFAQGKRHLIVGDISSAVNSLQEACKLLADQYGETAPECGDAYFCYGKALLELARMESGVIGNALDGEEGSTENEDEDSEADAESQEGESQEGEGEGDNEKEGDENGDQKEKEEVEGDQTEEDEEEISNLQLSWEMLELAKVIFEKQAESDSTKKAKVAEVFLKLGEVGLESENYGQGIEDFKQCLEIQKSVLKSDDRCLAETNYQLGIAYSFCDEFDLAIENFKSAVNVLETRIENLNKMKKEKEGWTEEQRMKDAATRVDPFYTEQGEIDELNQLLPEMKEKIVDMEQMKKDSKERIKAAKEAMMSAMGGDSPQGSSSSAFGAPSTSSSSSSSSQPAKPIMVVRKKRKLDEEVGGEETKKIKAESGISNAAVNGSKIANDQVENSSTAGTKEESIEKPSQEKKVELKSVS